jgi:hypothetical protein
MFGCYMHTWKQKWLFKLVSSHKIPAAEESQEGNIQSGLAQL